MGESTPAGQFGTLCDDTFEMVVKKLEDPRPLMATSKHMEARVRRSGAYAPVAYDDWDPIFPYHTPSDADLAGATHLEVPNDVFDQLIPVHPRVRRVKVYDLDEEEQQRVQVYLVDPARFSTPQPDEAVEHMWRVPRYGAFDFDAPFVPLTVRCVDGELPAGAAELLLAATHVCLEGFEGELPAMPRVVALSLREYEPGDDEKLHLPPSVLELNLRGRSWLQPWVAWIEEIVGAERLLYFSMVDAFNLDPDAEFRDEYELSAATHVLIDNCRDILLPCMPAATHVTIRFSRWLQSAVEIPSLPAATRVELRNLENLEEIPMLPAARTVSIRDCVVLAEIGALPLAETVILYGNSALEALPEVPPSTRLEHDMAEE